MSTDLEFSITQYLDGSLSESERDALEARLAADAEARVMLDQHRKLDALLKDSTVPQIHWDKLATQISAAVAEVEIPVEQESRVRLRMPWVRFGIPIALAASVLIAVGLAARFVRFTQPVNNPAGQAVAVIIGPQVETSAEPSDMQVTVGPSQVATNDAMASRYSDDVISRPAHVTVASGINAVQDINSADMQ